MRIGFIGAGIIGGGLARRALVEGHEVSVCDLRPEIREALGKEGAQVFEAAAQLGPQCDYIVLSLPLTEHVEAACYGPQGILSTMRKGSVLIDMSSTPPDDMKKLGEAVHAKGGWAIDAPLCPSQNRDMEMRPLPDSVQVLNNGGRAALAGNLQFFVGGPKEDVEKAKPVLDLLGVQHYHLGPWGSGRLVKLLHNGINITALAAIAEAAVIVKRHGLDVAAVIEALSTSLAASTMMSVHGKQNIARQYFPLGLYPMSFSEKDTRYAIDCGKAVGVTAGVMGATNALFQRALQSPWKEHYFATVFKVIEDESRE